MSNLSHFIFSQNIFIIKSWIYIEFLSPLSSLLSLHKISLFSVQVISTSNCCNNDNNDGESNWNDDNERISLFFKMNYLWITRINNNCCCLLSVWVNIFRLIFNCHCNCFSLSALTYDDIDISIKITGLRNVFLNIIWHIYCNWFVGATGIFTCYSSCRKIKNRSA